MTFFAPCKECDKRNESCHATCEEYKAWRKWKDERNAQRLGRKKIDEDLTSIGVDGVDFSYRRLNYRGSKWKKRVGQH